VGLFNKFAALLALLALPAAARAEWKEATSANFIVYSEGSRQQLTDFVTKLEKFNFVLRTIKHVTAPPSPIKLKVYLLADIGAVQRMAENDGVAGYYIQRARSPMMVGTRGSASTAGIDAESILLHEYTHHFMYGYFPGTYPTWYSEGFAEFFGATNILAKDVVEIGQPAEYRFDSFVDNRWVPLKKLLTAQSYADIPDLDLLYAEGWALVRYTFDHPDRQHQLDAYLTAVNRGATYEQAMKQAFPDIDRLDSQLSDFAGNSRFSVVSLPFRPINVGPIVVRTLRPAEQALTEYEIKLNQGSVLQRDAADFAGKVRASAGRFPDDPFALGLLAEVEQLAGNRDAAMAAVDHLLQVEPGNARGLMRKGKLRIAALQASGSTDAAAWEAARALLLAANRSAPNDPIVLEAYYDSFAARGGLPPAGAQSALYHAMELAPSDDELRYKVAADFEKRSMIPEALAIIRPVAFVLPHRKPESERKRKERETREIRNLSVGEQRHETAREMFERLQTKVAASQPAPPTPAG
jgi:tetratricopeptide (TPR) repeat protein